MTSLPDNKNNAKDPTIRPLKKFQNYVDYDFSKMRDSHGGFLFDEEENVTGGKQKKRKWQPVFQEDPRNDLSMDISKNPKCNECKESVDLDYQIKENFGVLVCIECRKSHTDKYSLLTKTEAKEDYLLTDSELRDSEVLPHWLKPNPRKATWNSMMLYLRMQVEEFAFKKWGGEEGLDKEYERRVADKQKKKEKQFKKKISDLRKRTRTDEVERSRSSSIHKHDWGDSVLNPETEISTQTCNTCGLKIEVVEF
ncbi:hypothetical protein G9A89_017905 [Geosiphon pyriformis]|nr:hypothetical protein G9A89_017905 [Geosiphon pyriformis]